ncbi:MAG: protein-export chaperone SecB [Paracoccaceae bacterium]|jgi:preprotein translocase subunit SecB|nr:protein-export protein SecB [Rhodobacteraceae bacterium HTCC2150]MDG1530584.1 protein-export chaperone SecB [Paracoccaceae bacterium]
MAEEAKTEGAAEAAPQPKMQILGQMIRDMSFENVAVQKGVQGQIDPDINVQVNLDAKKRSETQYEVSIKCVINSKNKADEAQIFLLEIDYAGVFQIENVPEEQLHPFLLIECPRMLFPFLRRIVSDVTRDGGFPPLNLETIDFVALYRNEIARRMAAEPTGTA